MKTTLTHLFIFICMGTPAVLQAQAGPGHSWWPPSGMPLPGAPAGPVAIPGAGTPAFTASPEPPTSHNLEPAEETGAGNEKGLQVACGNPPGIEAIAFQHVYGDSEDQATPSDGLVVTCDGGYAAIGSAGGKIYFFKTDDSGQVVFSRYFSSLGFELRGDGLVYAENDGYLLYGHASSMMQPGRGVLIKTDLQGSLQWAKSYLVDMGNSGLNNSFQVRGISEVVATADGNYVLAISNAKKTIVKIDPQGAVLSSLLMADVQGPGQTSPFLDYVTDMAPTADGGVVLTGFAFTTGVPLIKLNAQLAIQFAREFNDSSPFNNCEDVGGQVVQTPDGGYLIAGGTKSHGNSLCDGSFGGYYDAFVLKASASGNFVWARTIGGAGTGSFATGIFPIDNTNYLFSTQSSAIGSNGSLVYGSINHTNGTVNWSRIIDGACGDNASVQPTGFGGYVVNGSTGSAGNGGTDHLLLKMNDSLTSQGCLSSADAPVLISSYTPAFAQSIPEGYFLVNIAVLAFPVTVSDAAFTAQSTCRCPTVVTDLSDDDCSGSLRSAIRCANLNPGPDTITFDIDPAVHGQPPYVIVPKTALPSLASQTVVDGTTQPGFVLGAVTISGDSLSGAAIVSIKGGDNCVVKGLHLKNSHGVGAAGISLQFASGNKITSNLITNCGTGITLDSLAGNNLAEDNVIGTDAAGASDLGMDSHGVSCSSNSSGNIIRNNLIAFNKGAGINISHGSNQNRLSKNRMYCNGNNADSPPILLNGGNQDHPAPVISLASFDLLSGSSNPNDTIELFMNLDANCIGKPCQGKDYLGTATADASGAWALNAPFAMSISAGALVTATAADANNNTSGFSACEAVVCPGGTGLDCSLIAHYKLDGDALDASGNGNDGTISNTVYPARNRFDDCDRAMYFECSGSYTGSGGGHIQIPPVFSSATQSLTISMWVKEDTVCNSDGEGYIFFGDHNNGYLGIGHYSDSIYFGVGAGPLSPTVTFPFSDIPPGLFTHYGLVYENGVLRGYVNGMPIGQKSSQLYITSTAAAIARHFWWSTSTRFTGAIDDVRLYNRALSATEIQQLFNLTSDNPNQPPAAVVSAGSTMLCQGDSITLSANPVQAGQTYQWYRDGTIMTGATTSSLSVYLAGQYQVLITKTAGCDSLSQPLSIAVNPLPGAVITPAGPATFCQGATLVLNAAAGPGYTYQWQLNGANLPGATSSGYAATTSGNHSVVVTDGNGCTATSTPVAITVHPLPTAAIGGDNAVCAGENTTLTASGGNAYAWSNGSTLPAIVVSPAVNTIYTVTVTNANGCTDTESIAVTALPLPVAGISGDDTICEGETTVLTASGGSSSSWSNGSSQAAISVSPANTAAYSVTVTNPAGCTGQASTLVTVNALPVAFLTSNVQIPCNDGSAVQLDGSGSAPAGQLAFLWTTSNGNIVSGAGTATASVNQTGQYSLLVTNTATGCTQTAVTAVTLDAALQAQADAGAGGLSCDGTFSLDASLPPGLSGSWSAGAGVQFSEPDSPASMAFDLQPGQNTLTWSLSTPQCADFSADQVTVTLESPPDAEDDRFEVDHNTREVVGSLLSNDETPSAWRLDSLDGPSAGSLAYEYAAGERTGDFRWKALTYVDKAVFRYTLCSENCPGLCDTAVAVIDLAPRPYEVADGFTPDGDGVNETFVIPQLLENPGKYPDNDLTVFNRWGEVVYSASPYNNDWDGTYNGQPLPAGTYYYIIRLNLADGELRMKEVVIFR